MLTASPIAAALTLRANSSCFYRDNAVGAFFYFRPIKNTDFSDLRIFDPAIPAIRVLTVTKKGGAYEQTTRRSRRTLYDTEARWDAGNG